MFPRRSPINFEEARVLALQGISDYINRADLGTGDRYGQYHGAMGRARAKHLQRYLTSLAGDPDKKDANLLALFLAVFTNTPPQTSNRFFSFFSYPFRNIGRSSKLASLIADRWISGNITYGVNDNNPGSVTSTVFSRNMLNRVVRNLKNFRSAAINEFPGFSSLDQTKAVRRILKAVLNSPAFAEDKDAIIKSLPKLRAYLESDEDPRHFGGLKKLLLPFPGEIGRPVFGRPRL